MSALPERLEHAVEEDLRLSLFVAGNVVADPLGEGGEASFAVPWHGGDYGESIWNSKQPARDDFAPNSARPIRDLSLT